MAKVRRALVSVSDKRGVVEFAKGLNKLGVEILSTGGTAKLIKKGGIPVRSISDYTGHLVRLVGPSGLGLAVGLFWRGRRHSGGQRGDPAPRIDRRTRRTSGECEILG